MKAKVEKKDEEVKIKVGGRQCKIKQIIYHLAIGKMFEDDLCSKSVDYEHISGDNHLHRERKRREGRQPRETEKE